MKNRIRTIIAPVALVVLFSSASAMEFGPKYKDDSYKEHTKQLKKIETHLKELEKYYNAIFNVKRYGNKKYRDYIMPLIDRMNNRGKSKEKSYSVLQF